MITTAFILFTFLAVAGEAEGVLNKDEFSSLLLGQLIQILTVLAGIGVSYKALRRNPSVGEDIVKLQARADAFEARFRVIEDDIKEIKDRLKDGDGVLRDGAVDIATLETALDAIKADVHTIKMQMPALIAKAGKAAHSH